MLLVQAPIRGRCISGDATVTQRWRGVEPLGVMCRTGTARPEVGEGPVLASGPPRWPARWLQGLSDCEAVPWASAGGLAVSPSEKVPVRLAVCAQATTPRSLAEPADGLCNTQRAGLASPVKVRGAVE